MTKKQYTAFLFLSIGFGFAVMAVDLDLGTFGKMGPGMFPLLIACILIAISTIYAFKSTKEEEPMDLDLMDLAKVLAIMFISVITFKHVGLLAAILILVPLMATLHREFNLKYAAISTAVAATLTIILKVTVLKSIPLW